MNNLMTLEEKELQNIDGGVAGGGLEILLWNGLLLTGAPAWALVGVAGVTLVAIGAGAFYIASKQ